MTKETQQWYSLTEEALGKLVGQGTYPGAIGALEKVMKIRDAGHTATVFYSGQNGFRVLDEDEDDQFRQSMSLEQRAKRFPS
jgi:hypothetical protein